MMQVFKARMVVHVSTVDPQFVGRGPDETDRGEVGVWYIAMYNTVLVAEEALVLLEVLVQAFGIMDGGINIVLGKPLIK